MIVVRLAAVGFLAGADFMPARRNPRRAGAALRSRPYNARAKK